MTLCLRPSTSAHGPKPVLSAAAGSVEGLGTNGRWSLAQKPHDLLVERP